MVTISLCMIVRDEEETLPRCLDSVRSLVDEIVLVDTGSLDKTREIARTYTDLVFDFPWQDDFSPARNFSFSKAGMDYCLWLDADDVIEPADQAAFLTLKAGLSPDTDLVMLPYHGALDNGGRPIFTYYRERLLRREAGFVWQGAVHEAISPKGKVVYGQAAVTHKKIGPGDPDRNLRIFQKQLAAGKSLSPREQFYYARELLDHDREGEAAGVLEAYLFFDQGWVENKLEACRLLSRCYERQGRPEKAFEALLKSLRYGPPRAELCCDLGQFFFDRADFGPAIFWYELALTRRREDKGGGFVRPDCYGYIPCLQLCLCHHRLGNNVRAAEYNEQAGHFKPEDPAYLHNKAFFARTLNAAP